MNVKQLKEFLDTLPTEFDKFELSNGVYSMIDNEEEDEENFHYRMDKPIMVLYIDEENGEFLLLHQEQAEINEITGQDDKD